MNWILFGVVFILAQQHQLTITKKWLDFNLIKIGINGNRYVMATPLPQGPSLMLSPYIRYWEAARFDRKILDTAQRVHDANQRRKRDTNFLIQEHKNSHQPYPHSSGQANIIRLNFNAHDREFRLVLHEDPSSVFSPDIEIENTSGPVEYDVSRVYTGALEDDENSHVHGILTSDNLFDGTIATQFEDYYVEPSLRYSTDLHENGVHSIVYKLSDVKMRPLGNTDSESTGSLIQPSFLTSGEHCASERLHQKLRNEYKTKWRDDYKKIMNKKSGNKNRKRKKRWLPEELTESQNVPLPLDLDVPYNDDFNIVARNPNKNDYDLSEATTIISPTNYVIGNSPQSKQDQRHHHHHHPSRKNILVNNYNPNSDYNLRNTFNNRNIIVNNYDNNNNNNNNLNINNNNNNNNNNLNIKIGGNYNMSRPSHKTHVEIITKNGATKKPNIIVNNYNPDMILTSSNYNNYNLNVRNDLTSGASDNPRTAYDRKSTCMLYLQADHTFFQKMGSDEASIESITRHVQRANTIYKNTDFNGDGKPDNITFMIKRIKIHNMNALKDPKYRFPGNYGVEKFLELFSEEDYDAFCLAYMFTYRDFEMGTLGLAWTGDLKNAGGVCEKNGHYRGSLKSLNTGIVTLLNYGKHVPPAVSHVTLAHEIGHNFGSPHDPEQCTPGGEDGNFIMFARATSGDKRNNNKFSPCSLKAIEPVLNAKARSAKGCFTEPQQSICGNGVVEPGEECDCGWEEDCKDTCCYPMSRIPPLDEKPCTLTPKASCSPSQGPCCTMECALKFGDKCRDDNGCRDPSFCDGQMPQCPPSVNKANKTICNKEFVCYMGECTGSICLAYGLESCQCIPGPNDPKTKSCELCCKIPGENNQCKSSFEWNEPPYDVPDMFAKPGTPCNDYNGYCDVFQKCREVDPSGPLATLRKLLLSEESLASFRKWVESNWFIVAAVIIVIIILLVLSTKLLGKRSNLKLKSVTIIHSATTETVRLPDDNNGVIVHTAVRTKVPLKKKVRGERATKSKTGIVPVKSKDIIPSSSKMAKRQGVTAESPKKAAKKKKRVSAPIVAEEQNKGISDPAPIKMKKQKKSKAKHKEIIDYSNRPENHSNTFGKVQKWLLESPIVAQPPPQIEHSSKITNIMSKSQSTPERLVQRSPMKTKSVGNLNEKVRLQVVYKPPFKFSLKLSKNNSAVKTHVLGSGIGRNKRKTRLGDKKRVSAAAVTASVAKDITQQLQQSRTKRTALLVRTTTVDDSCAKELNSMPEPTYETLKPVKKEPPVYENLNITTPDDNAINTATFRVNKSASGSNLMLASANGGTSKANSFTNSSNTNTRSSRGSTANINQLGGSGMKDSRRSSISNSNTNLTKQFGSSQNLMRSSTTNLTRNRSSFDMKRGEHDLNRRSTTNMTKDERRRNHGSTYNLKRDSSHSNLVNNEETHPAHSRSRRNSSSNNNKKVESLSKANLPRVPSNSNIRASSLAHRTDSISNIPRASLNIINSNFNRQKSLQPRQNTSDFNGLIRPHTSSCDDPKHFDWPKVLIKDKRLINEPLPSDLEVMVSDVENLVNDR